MGELEKYQRATPNEIDSLLLKTGKIKQQPDLFPEIYDSAGNEISIERLSRNNELTGAGVEYITSVCEYVYTHHLNKIKRKNNVLYDTLPTLEWGAFLEIASGGMSGQAERIERTVMQYQAKPKTTLMIDADGNLHARWPFILDFLWEGQGKLDKKNAARFARLSKSKRGKKTDAYTGLITPRLPIQKVTIMAAKPLFEIFFKKNPSTYSFPTGLYAKMYDIANSNKKNLLKNNAEIISRDDIFKFVQAKDSNLFISAYANFIRYITRHNNLTGTQMKDKEYSGTIKLDKYDFLREVYPSLIHNGNKGKSIDSLKFIAFMLSAQSVVHSISGFLIYPVWVGIEGQKIVFNLFTDQRRALDNNDYLRQNPPKIHWKNMPLKCPPAEFVREKRPSPKYS